MAIVNEAGVSQEIEVDAHSGSIVSRGHGEQDETHEEKVSEQS